MRKFDHEDFLFIIRRTGRQHQLKNQRHGNEQNKARLEMFKVLNFHGLNRQGDRRRAAVIITDNCLNDGFPQTGQFAVGL